MKNLLYLLFVLPLLFSCGGGVDYEPLRGTYSGTLYIADGQVPGQSKLEVGYGENGDMVRLRYTVFGEEIIWVGHLEEDETGFIMRPLSYPEMKNEYDVYPTAKFSDDHKTVVLSCDKDGFYGPFNGTLTKE